MEKNIWTDFAKSYDLVLRNWSLYQELRDNIVKYTENCNTVFDQGCGTGIIAIDLAKKGKKVYGIDNNKEMLAKALENIDESIVNRIALREGDAHKIEFEDLCFDAVVSNNVIFYVNEPIRVLTEAHRVLKKGGIMTLSGPVPNPDIGKLAQHITNEFKQKGIYESMNVHLAQFLECSVKLKSTGMPNTYRSKELAGILTGNIGFSDIILENEKTYAGESYFIVARK